MKNAIAAGNRSDGISAWPLKDGRSNRTIQGIGFATPARFPLISQPLPTPAHQPVRPSYFGAHDG